MWQCINLSELCDILNEWVTLSLSLTHPHLQWDT